jgi:hypothetical protein
MTRGTQLRLVGGELARSECVFGRADGRRGGAGADFVALGQQVGDVAFGVQDALALHFGRVRCEHGRDKAVRQRGGHGPRRDARPAQALQRNFDAAFLRVAGTLVDGPASDVMPVLGQVGQVAEVGEGADHAHRLVT